MDSVDYKIVKNQMGGSELIVDGFSFIKNRDRGKRRYWICTQKRHGTRCKASARTEDDKLIFVADAAAHNHLPEPKAADIKTLRYELKRKAKDSTERPEQLIQETLKTLNVESQSLLTKEALRQIVKRARKVSKMPGLSGTFDQHRPEELKKTLDGREFLRREIEVDNEEILLFCTDDDLRRLSEASFWICDRISIQTVFTQLYTIHASIGIGSNREIVPLVYALMTSRSEECYTRLFEELQDLPSDVELDPNEILTDFEKAQHNAIKTVFPRARQRCCFFHLAQTFYRHVQWKGLSSKFSEDAVYAVMLRQIPALAFLPADEIPKAFEEICKLLGDEEADLLGWFGNTYVLGTPTRHNTRREPLFPPRMWSLDSTEAPKTDNNIESWHSRWELLVGGGSQVDVYTLIKELQKEKRNTDIKAEELLSGRISESSQKQSYAAKERWIQDIIRRKESMSTQEFLRGIAYNYSL